MAALSWSDAPYLFATAVFIFVLAFVVAWLTLR